MSARGEGKPQEVVQKLRPPEIPGRGQCRYIYGDLRSGNTYWCCETTYQESSWCKVHYELCVRLKYADASR